MKKFIYHFLFAILLMLSFVNCEEGLPEPTGINFITFDEASKSFLLDEGSTINTEIKIFTASNVGSDLVIDLATTTTLDASNYTLPSSVTIPANSNEGVIELSITENNLDKINGETLDISFSSPNGYFNGETGLSITVNVFCPSEIAGSYIYSDGNQKSATITADTNVNNFILSGDNAFGSNYFIKIKDQCGSISVTGGELQSRFGIPVSGSGTVLSNGNIELVYTVEGYFNDRTMTLVKQ